VDATVEFGSEAGASEAVAAVVLAEVEVLEVSVAEALAEVGPAVVGNYRWKQVKGLPFRLR
jgi:hypothetical protein